MSYNFENFYENCVLCPRNCRANRTEKKSGYCAEGSRIRLAAATIHFGEEPPITVVNGSGTIFVTGCNLRCAFCQNYQISQNGMGKEVSAEEFAEICLKLQDEKAENINIVTGSHHVPAIAKALEVAKSRGLKIPVCWNSSGYEKTETLEMLDGLVDIWLPDMKSLNALICEGVFNAVDYPSVCKKTVRWMMNKSPLKYESVRQVRGEKDIKRFGGSEIEKMTSGVVIRHLILPGRLDDTKIVLDWLKKNADGKACISLMSQYTPVKFDKEESEKRRDSLSCFQHRLMNREEFKKVQEMIAEYDFECLFYQELTEDTDWLPDFKKSQPFSNELSKTVWHWVQ